MCGKPSFVCLFGSEVPSGWDACRDDINAVMCCLPSAVILWMGDVCFLRDVNGSAFKPLGVGVFVLLFSVYGSKVTVAV